MDSDVRLHTSDFRLQTSQFRIQTSDLSLQTSDLTTQNSDFRLQTSNFGLDISDFSGFRLRISNFGSTGDFELQIQTSDTRLQTSDFRRQSSGFSLKSNCLKSIPGFRTGRTCLSRKIETYNLLHTYIFIPKSSMQRISFFSPEQCCFAKISKTTALFSNQNHSARVFWIPSLIQSCKALKSSHSLIKFAFASHMSRLYISRRQVAVSLQIILAFK